MVKLEYEIFFDLKLGPIFLKIKLEKDFDNFSPKILNNKNKKIIKINCIKYLINFIYLGF